MEQSTRAWIDVCVCQIHLTIGSRFTNHTQLLQIPTDDSVEIADNQEADDGQKGEQYEMEPLFGKGWKITTTV